MSVSRRTGQQRAACFLPLLAASILLFNASVGHASQPRNGAGINGVDAQIKLVF